MEPEVRCGEEGERRTFGKLATYIGNRIGDCGGEREGWGGWEIDQCRSLRTRDGALDCGRRLGG